MGKPQKCDYYQHLAEVAVDQWDGQSNVELLNLLAEGFDIKPEDLLASMAPLKPNEAIACAAMEDYEAGRWKPVQDVIDTLPEAPTVTETPWPEGRLWDWLVDEDMAGRGVEAARRAREYQLESDEAR